jgi:hypothetical protein
MMWSRGRGKQDRANIKDKKEIRGWEVLKAFPIPGSAFAGAAKWVTGKS